MNRQQTIVRLSTKIKNSLTGTSRPRRTFFTVMFLMYLGIRGKRNYLNLQRYAPYSEKQIGRHMARPYDFFDFNFTFIAEECKDRHIIWASDCTYIKKSGKCTYGKDNFWSGCDQRSLPGLEVSSLCAVDVEGNIACHLEAKQTPANLGGGGEDGGRMDFYANQITDKADKLKEISPYIVYDGAAAKKTFIDKIEESGLHLVSRLRKDANLRYLNEQEYQGVGRAKLYDGKVNMKNPDLSRFNLVLQNEELSVYSAIVFSPAFKRRIHISYVRYNSNTVCLFSTDIHLDGKWIYRYYKARFQIVFTDAKQISGLNDCQARSENKLYNHFNFSLTCISLAKSLWYEQHKEDTQRVWSSKDLQTQIYNRIMLDTFLSSSGINPDMPEIKSAYQQMLYFGCRIHEDAA